ncbi:MAG: phosphonate metabolism transcriptional regulator PhnF [Pseudomonadota bacterium]
MKTPTRTQGPIWRAIADTLRHEIASGAYRVGDKLPTEQALADRFGVNRHTVRHAMAQLVEDDMVRTRRGAGAFVRAKPTDYPIGKRVRFHENLLAAGREPTRRALLIEQRAATSGESAALDIDAGAPVCTFRGISLADGEPVALFESLFPLARLAGIDAALRDATGITDALKRVGIDDYTRASTRVTAVLADATQAAQLHVAVGDPLLRTSAVNVDSQDKPVEYGKTWFAGDRVTLAVEP